MVFEVQLLLTQSQNECSEEHKATPKGKNHVLFILATYNVNSQLTKQGNKTASGWHLQQ